MTIYGNLSLSVSCLDETVITLQFLSKMTQLETSTRTKARFCHDRSSSLIFTGFFFQVKKVYDNMSPLVSCSC